MASVEGVPSPSIEDLQKLAMASKEDAADPRRRLMDLLDERYPFSAPKDLVDHEFRAIWRLIEADRKAGKIDPYDAGKNERQLRHEYRAIADRRVRLGLIIGVIARRISFTHESTVAIENEVIDFIFGLAE